MYDLIAIYSENVFLFAIKGQYNKQTDHFIAKVYLLHINYYRKVIKNK